MITLVIGVDNLFMYYCEATKKLVSVIHISSNIFQQCIMLGHPLPVLCMQIEDHDKRQVINCCAKELILECFTAKYWNVRVMSN